MIGTASPSPMIRHDRTQYTCSDRSNLNSAQANEAISSMGTHVPLYRYVHMNDDQNTQIFTFLLLPHLLCGLLDEVESAPFSYAQHWWTVRFQRSNTHLGVFLELKYTNSSLPEDQILQAPFRTPGDQVQWATVSVDFQFTVKNREHFTRNESFSRSASVFHRNQSTHGRRKFMELTALSSKRYIYDDGMCVIDLELKNPNVLYNIWGSVCPDPTASPRSINHSDSVVNLMRLDGSVISVGKSIHLESERFVYAESQWFLNLDLEPMPLSSAECQGQPIRATSHLYESDIVVNAELSLVRYTGKSTEIKQQTSLSPSRSFTSRIKCSALLPGGCHTKVMEFSIGTHGWPTQAYRIQFRAPNKDDMDNKTTQDTRDSSRKTTKADEPAGSGSPTALILSSVSSSPINIKLQIMSFSNVSFIEVPLTTHSSGGTGVACLIDPLQLPLYIQASNSGRLLRLKFQSTPTTKRIENGRTVRHKFSQSTRQLPSNSICILGCRIRINPLVPQLHAQVLPVGTDLVELLRFTSSSKFGHSLIDPTDETESILLNTNTNSPSNKKMTDFEKESPARAQGQNRIRWTSVDSDEVCEVAMNVTVDEAEDKNAGLLNPLNGTIFVEIQWVYNQVICIDRFHTADLINARQYHQMRNELNQLRKERDELERLIMIKEMGLIQIDPNIQGPRSMLPLESLGPVTTTEIEQNQVLSRSPGNGPSMSSSRDRLSMGEPRAARRYVHGTAVDSRDIRRSSRPVCGNRAEFASRNEIRQRDASGGSSSQNPRYSFEYESNLEDIVQMDNGSIGHSSVKSDRGTALVPERRKQFIRSKTAWQTYEGPHVQQTAEQFSPQIAHAAGSLYWTKPRGHRMKHLGTGDGRSPSSSSNCSPRTCFQQQYEENDLFY